jgi:hypothetical protein
VIVDYGNIAAPATVAVTLSGPATFADGSQALTAQVTSAGGSYTFDNCPYQHCVLASRLIRAQRGGCRPRAAPQPRG